jgi:CRP-like cAMP-binding protein
MSPETIPKALQELAFTRDMTPEQTEKLADLAFEVSFPEDFTIFRETDAGELLYLIREGQVALYVSVPGQGRKTILTLGPGQILGWSSLFPSGRKTASARTVTATEALAFNAAQLREAMDADTDLGYAILWRVADVVASRLKATRLQLLDIFAPSREQ